MSTHTEISPGAQRLLEGALTRRRERLLAREQLADGVVRGRLPGRRRRAGARSPRPTARSHPGSRSALVAAYALVADAEFPSGAGFAVPTQIMFVPMLLLLPTPMVPLLVALALAAHLDA